MPPVRAQTPIGSVGITISAAGRGDNPGDASNATVQIVDVGANIAGVCSFRYVVVIVVVVVYLFILFIFFVLLLFLLFVFTFAIAIALAPAPLA
jgi:hypothetical protein